MERELQNHVVYGRSVHTLMRGCVDTSVWCPFLASDGKLEMSSTRGPRSLAFVVLDCARGCASLTRLSVERQPWFRELRRKMPVNIFFVSRRCDPCWGNSRAKHVNQKNWASF